MANVPVPFPGSDAEADRNYDTHLWAYDADQIFCDRCLAKPWHVAANYPCGEEPPRMETEGDGGQMARFLTYAAATDAALVEASRFNVAEVAAPSWHRRSCATCGGADGAHGLVHRRHPTGASPHPASTG